MENLITRYRNVTILAAVLFAQVLGLAVQVKRSSEDQSSRLIRVWAVNAVTPAEKVIIWFQSGVSNLWHSYFYLRGVRQENRGLKAEIERLRLEQVRLSQDAEQAHRLQALLGFKEQFISHTLAAQVIGSSGSEQSRSVYIDKGAREGVGRDMAVITADGVVGKVLHVFGSKPFEASTSQVLLINDQTSGVGAILEKSRLQGVLRGTPAGEVVLEKVMADEKVQPGEKVLTSGGDQIFPKGLSVGTVTEVSPGKEKMFLNIRVRPAASLSRLEEVLVITKNEAKTPSIAETGPVRAVDILAQRLPSVPDKPPENPTKQSAAGARTSPQPAATSGKPETAGTANSKPHENGGLTASKPLTNTPGITRPAGSPVVKPATAQKPAPPAVKVSQPTTKPASTEPKPNPAPPQKPAQPPAETAPSEDKPQ
ncbi:MAG: rod shape-determining protein MreC [Acidobacteria bacterium 13_1_40CM_4_58_4]|nr:MAG: rod shape-determining protein MreC [Acidobacteria bacterium 13_1_40CM_4_58_4]HLB88507.1 rod shape-determining protein MreC [Terriglobales bacterium]